jgi:serine protease
MMREKVVYNGNMRRVLVFVITVLLLIVFDPGLTRADSLKEASLEKSIKYDIASVVVKFRKSVGTSEMKRFKNFHNTRITKQRKYANFVTLSIPAGLEASEFAEKLKYDSRIEYVEANFLAYTQMIPNDPYYQYQWHFDNDDYGGVEAEGAWDISTGSGVVVAVVDTGIAYENYRQWWRRYEKAPDLAGTCFIAGYDFVNNDSHANDDEGHGTHVSGTIAQATNNSIGVAGLAHSSCLMPVKVLNNRGSGTYADIAEGIRFATDNGAQVINLSLGGSSDSRVLREAVSYAYNKGVVIVAAAGNNGEPDLLYPAAYDDYVISVGATRYDQTLADYSNYGESLDFVAPGGDLNVDQNDDGYKDGVLQQTFDRSPSDWGYWFYQGTSMATPHVSATAALVISSGVTNPNDVRIRLETTAKDLGDSGKDNTFGWGLIDAWAALEGVLPDPMPTPEPSPTPIPEITSTPTPLPTPTSTPLPTPTPTATATPLPTPTPSPSPTPTPESEKPWWCKYFPSHYRCR